MQKNKVIEEMIRVDHAGELGAKWIYEGQLGFLKDEPTRQKVQVMRNQELEHLTYFSEQVRSRHVRPTALMPAWKFVGKAVGAISGFMGPKTAMACTEAVEEVIDEHYEKQIIQLEVEHPEEIELIAKLKQFRQEECEHKDEASSYLQPDSALPLHKKAMKKVFQFGVRAAIKISKRV